MNVISPKACCVWFLWYLVVLFVSNKGQKERIILKSTYAFGYIDYVSNKGYFCIDVEWQGKFRIANAFTCSIVRAH